MQPASVSFGGIVTTGAQSFAGAKSFTSDIGLANATSINYKNAAGTTRYLINVDSSDNTRIGSIGGSVTINPDNLGGQTTINQNTSQLTTIYYNSSANIEVNSVGVAIGDASSTRGLTLRNSTASYTAGVLNYYEEYSTTFTFNDTGTNISATTTMKIIRTGKQVSIQLYEMSSFSDTAGARSNLISVSAIIPTRFRTNSNFVQAVHVYAGAYALGICKFNTSGDIQVYTNPALSASTWGASSNAFYGTTVSYNLN